MPLFGPSRILIVSDAWLPQVNGVVRTLSMVRDELRLMGHTVDVIGPERFRSIACPTYPEIRLALVTARRVAAEIEAFRPDALHIATEGPLGLAARRWARQKSFDFTTSFHTRFPEYLQARTGIPTGPAYRFLRWFHGAATRTLVPTQSILDELRTHGFTHLTRWSRGVDIAQFHADAGRDWFAEFGVPGPYFLNVGRVAVEKNLEAFLSLDLPGTKIVVGDGPARAELAKTYPDVLFVGALHGDDLRAAYAGSDVFVFPSRTDTFGLVILEALACGLPVCAYDSPGPRDIFASAPEGIYSIGEDLRAGALRLLEADRAACVAHARTFSWGACAATFADGLRPVGMHHVEALDAA